MKLLVLMLFLFSSIADGQELTYMGLAAGKFYNKRDPYFPSYHLVRERSQDGEGHPETWNHHLSLLLDSTLIDTTEGSLYWNQVITGNSTTVQYREVKWEWELGINVKYEGIVMFSPFWQHMSRHWLEGSKSHLTKELIEQREKYPLEDTYGIRFCFLGCTR